MNINTTPARIINILADEFYANPSHQIVFGSFLNFVKSLPERAWTQSTSGKWYSTKR